MKISVVILSFLFLIFTAHAATVTFDVSVVQASKQGSSFDAGLSSYKDKLMEMGFRSGQVISSQRLNSKLNEKKSFTVKGNLSAEITPTSVKDGFINFDLRLTDGSETKVKLSYKIPNGKDTIIVCPSSSKKTRYVIIIKAKQ